MRSLFHICRLLLFLCAAVFLSTCLCSQPSANLTEEIPQRICYWEAERNGQTSILFGTFRTAEIRLPEDLQKAVSQSRIVLLEINDLSDFNNKMYQALLPPKQSLNKMVSQETYRKAVKFFQSKGMTEDWVNRLKPWYLALTGLHLQDKASFSQKLPCMDLQISRAAQENGVPSKALGTLDEHILYFDALPPSFQEDLLAYATGSRARKDIIQLSGLYFQGDDEKASHLINTEFALSGTPQLFQKIFVMRNHRLNEKILPYLEKGGAFVAIGFGHLISTDGLLSFLEKEGFTLTKKYFSCQIF